MSEKSEKPAEKPDTKPETKSGAKAEEKAIKAVEEHVNPDDTEVPDHTAQRKVEAHRQAEVRRSTEATTGDDSAVNPQPDRDAPGEPSNFAPIVEGERQATEQPDRYAVGDEMTEYAVEPNSKNKRGRRKKADEEPGEAPLYPAQYQDVKNEDLFPPQYSW